MNNSDRYILLISHMGLIEQKSRRWNPFKDKPLLYYLQDYIDDYIFRIAGKEFINAQKELLKNNNDVNEVDIAIKNERERCALICEDINKQHGEFPELALYCAEAIRNRRS